MAFGQSLKLYSGFVVQPLMLHPDWNSAPIHSAAPVQAFLVSVILSNELVEPAEDFVVPLETISMVQNPMVLIRENHQATRDTSPTS